MQRVLWQLNSSSSQTWSSTKEKTNLHPEHAISRSMLRFLIFQWWKMWLIMQTNSWLKDSEEFSPCIVLYFWKQNWNDRISYDTYNKEDILRPSYLRNHYLGHTSRSQVYNYHFRRWKYSLYSWYQELHC